MSSPTGVRAHLPVLVVAIALAVAALAAGAFADSGTPGGSSAAALPAYGAFVLGDRTVAAATSSDTVTWWSHSWWTTNTLAGGPAPASFKGFASDFSSSPPTCGDTWTTTPGNSPHPPDSVPGLMTVLVASSITKAGSTISGNIVKVVVVATDGGYEPNPGHPGTGRIVATICSGGE